MKLRYVNWGFAALITTVLAGCGGDDHQDSAQLRAVHASPDAPKPYTAGTWGPSAAVALIERDGRTWHEDTDL